MKSLSIGIFGAPIKNVNLGCEALTYSLLSVLEDISKETDIPFLYYIFGSSCSEDSVNHVMARLGISKNRIISVDSLSLCRGLRSIKHPFKVINAHRKMNLCDVFIDLTIGDSFTDIYGHSRFVSLTKPKLLLEDKGKALILGPQTYGPIANTSYLKMSKLVFDRAKLIIARDAQSAEFVSKLSNHEVYTTTDLAFSLPYSKCNNRDEKIEVGINISSLLLESENNHTKLSNEMDTDYREYMESLLNWFSTSELYEVFIVPHVGRDGGEEFKSSFTSFHYLEPFSDPIEAKSFISGLDIFIGARMHSTIAAVSSGVATIPTGYSRKFSGLFENIEYNYSVDLQNLKTKDALNLTIKYIKDYEKLKKQAKSSVIVAKNKSKETYELLRDELKLIYEETNG